MAKTESTAVTRLIELARSRPIDPEIGEVVEVDWFGVPMGKPKKRIEREKIARGRRPEDEVTKVVRVPGRKIVASPAMVVGAFFAGVLTVAVTMLVTGTGTGTGTKTKTETETEKPATGDRRPATGNGNPAAAPTTTVAAIVAPAPEPTPAPIVLPVIKEEPLQVAVTVPVPVPMPMPMEEKIDRPTRPARTRAPASFTRPRVGRPVAKEGGSPLAELRVNSKPPCQLYIDGRDMGWTPQRGISVPPGRHVVVFRNREIGVERKVIVDAKVGEVHRVIRDFTEP